MRASDEEIYQWVNKSAIEEVLNKYAILADTGDVDDLVALFTEDGLVTWRQFGVRVSGHDALRSYVENAVKVSEAEDGGMQHGQMNHVVTLTGENSATAISELHLIMSNEDSARMVSYGFYDTVLQKLEGKWKIKERHVRTPAPHFTGRAMGRAPVELP